MHDLRQAEFPDVIRPALRVALLSRLEDFPALRQDALGLAVMALTRRDVAKGTVPVLMVVPLGKLLNPVLSLGQGSEPLGGEARPVLERLEGRLGEGFVVTHPRSLSTLLAIERLYIIFYTDIQDKSIRGYLI